MKKILFFLVIFLLFVSVGKVVAIESNLNVSGVTLYKIIRASICCVE